MLCILPVNRRVSLPHFNKVFVNRLDTSAAASPPRTSTRRNATEPTAENTKIKSATGGRSPLNRLAIRPLIPSRGIPILTRFLMPLFFS